MSGRIRFVNLLHSHQPIGNFDHVIEDAYRRCYRPFVELYSEYPDIPLTNHFSGCLLEWLDEKHPDYLDLIRERTNPSSRAARPWELIGGGFYEPIVTMLHERDCAGQIELMADFLKSRFGAKPRGMWLAERVWEPALVSRLADAGVEYLSLDDSHFKAAGLYEEELLGGFVSESEGRMLTIYPASEKLRYMIPFHPVRDVMQHLQSLLPEDGERVVCYADDGEKFGIWPKTYESVYKEGWLRDFLDALRKAQEEGWLFCSTMGDAHDAVAPAGRVYIPENSYREMTEWALPAERLAAYERTLKLAKNDPRLKDLLPLVRGGNWRSFRVKYPECGQMYAKMMEVSAKIAELPKRSKFGQEARKHLFRGQCNCPYWHGVFGGAYLPHLRSSVYRQLILADNLADEVQALQEPVVERDFDFDGEPEIKLSNPKVALYLHPFRGGHIYEFDLREIAFNVNDGFARRYEAYHDLVELAVVGDEETHKSIHDSVRAKEEGLVDMLKYDTYLRESLVDHLSEEPLTPERLFSGDPGSDVEFRTGIYDVGQVNDTAGLNKDECAVTLFREAPFSNGRLKISKRVIVGGEASYRVFYRVLNKGETDVCAFFAVENNYSMLAGNAPDRYFYHGGTENAGKLEQCADFGIQPYIGLKDHWLKVALTLRPSVEAQVLVSPVKTVSQSEGGFESVYQSSSVVLQWPLNLKPGQTFSVELVQEVHRVQ